MSELFNLLAVIIGFGLVLWLVNAFIPMPGIISGLLNMVVLIVLIIYVMQFFGLISHVLPMIKLFK